LTIHITYGVDASGGIM